jgi:hypothetical protein
MTEHDEEGLEGVEMDGVLEVERIFAGLPITVNVGFPGQFGGPGLDTTVIGNAFGFRNKDDGTTTIILTLDPEASKMLGDLTEVFDLKALGFAGLKRKPANEGNETQ